MDCQHSSLRGKGPSRIIRSTVISGGSDSSLSGNLSRGMHFGSAYNQNHNRVFRQANPHRYATGTETSARL